MYQLIVSKSNLIQLKLNFKSIKRIKMNNLKHLDKLLNRMLEVVVNKKIYFIKFRWRLIKRKISNTKNPIIK